MSDPIPGITNPISPSDPPPPEPGERETVVQARAALQELMDQARNRKPTATIGEVRDPRAAPILMTRLEYEGLVARVEELERQVATLNQRELKRRIKEIDKRIKDGENLDLDIKPKNSQQPLD